MAMPKSVEVLKGLSLQATKDWGAEDPVLVFQFSGFVETVQPADVFFFFSEFPGQEVINDEEVERIEMLGGGAGVIEVRSADAARRASEFHGLEFDGRTVQVVPMQNEQPSTANTPEVHREEPAVESHNEPEPIREPQRDAPTRGGDFNRGGPRDNPRDNPRSGAGIRDNPRAGGGGYENRYADRDRRGGGGGGYGDREQRGGGGSGYGDRDRRGGGGGYGDRRDGGQGTGYGGGDRDRDGQREGSGFDGRANAPARRQGDESLEMTEEEIAKQLTGRKKMVFKSKKPAPKPAPTRAAASSSIFGNAKPREENIKQKVPDSQQQQQSQQQSKSATPQSSDGGASSQTSNQKGSKPNPKQRQKLSRPTPSAEPKKPQEVRDKNAYDILAAGDD